MLTSHNDNVVSLLASIGLNVDRPEDIVIQNFDQWTNCDSHFVASCLPTGAVVETPMGAAA